MPLSNGCNHVTILTSDIESCIDFYCRIFDARLDLDQDEGPLRHALIDLGGGFWLHPFQFADANPHQSGSEDMFNRGHIDHLAINMPDEASFEKVRARLVRAGATEGRVRDFGRIDVLTFTDPDGMKCEIALNKSGPVLSLEQSTTREYEPAT